MLAKPKSVESQLSEALHSNETGSTNNPGDLTSNKAAVDGVDSTAVRILQLLGDLRTTSRNRMHSLRYFIVSTPSPRGHLAGLVTWEERPGDISPPLASAKAENSLVLVKPGTDIVKTTPAGDYLTSALNDFDPEQYDSLAAKSDGATSSWVLAAVIKTGASREHGILAEIRDAVFAFIRKMEPKKVMDTMLVSRVRILYIRSLLFKSTN
ncbi:hypothetical protein CASFOL_042374 [Castilleja foliolosa]|uniref:Uncharacterized protein n=1 Tax=Castilleja foliolosa TaxID=1961234 RepID=A0ABD3BAB6_9LAMI